MTASAFPNTPVDMSVGALAQRLIDARAPMLDAQKTLGAHSAAACLCSAVPLLDKSRKHYWKATDTWLGRHPAASTGAPPTAVPPPPPLAPKAGPMPLAELVDLLLGAADAARLTDREVAEDLDGLGRAELAALSFAGGPEPAGLRSAAAAAIDAWRVQKKQKQGPASAPASTPAAAVTVSAPTAAATSGASAGKPIAPTVLSANIPPELQAGPYWVLWAFTWNGKKWTKPPRQRNGQLASSTNPATWCTLAEALAALALRKVDGTPAFDGIGHTFSPADPLKYWGFDLDHCIHPDANGKMKLDPEAQQAIKELNCYTELSPSGDGVHIIGLGELPGPHFTNVKLNREGYDSTKAGRYLTMTGQRLQGFETLRAADPAVLSRWYNAWTTHGPAAQATSGAKAGAQSSPKATSTSTASATTAMPASGAPQAQPYAFITNVVLDNRGLPQDMVDLIRRQDGLDRHYHSNGSLAVYAACIEMARAGFSDLEMLSVLTDPANALADVALRRRKRNRQSAAQWVAKYRIGQARNALANGTTAASLQGKGDHYTLAMAYLDRVEHETGHAAVYSRGSFWTVQDNLWIELKVDAAAVAVGKHFGGRKNVMKSGDFKAVAATAAAIVEDPEFFDRAPPGVAGPDTFWRVDGGKVVSEPLAPDHRQRMKLASDPVLGQAPPKFTQMLLDGIGTDADALEQIELLRICLGAALIGILWKYRAALCLIGPTTTGKSKVIEVFSRFFPVDMVGATSPAKWDKEYFLAGLAGKRLNCVGELDPHHPIPGGAFKAVVGGDPLEGRHPNHRPFSFVSMAAHVFNGNRLPPTADRSDAFFKRWRIVRFMHSRSADQIDVDLADTIIATELPLLAGWVLEAAAKLPDSELPTSAMHRAALEKWRYENNSAAAFVLDESWCLRAPDAKVTGVDLHRAYGWWAKENGMQPFGRPTFYENLGEVAGALRIARKESHNATFFEGVSLNPVNPQVTGVFRPVPPAPATDGGEKQQADAPT